MNLTKTLKSYALYTLLYVCIFTATYIGCSLINLSFNLKNWFMETRILLFVLPFVITLGKCIVDYLEGGE